MESKIDLNLLHTVILLCKLKSLKMVGLKLGKSESAISKHISKLQAQSGQVLFERTPSGLQPTEFTLSILPKLEQALATIDQCLFQSEFIPASYTDRITLALPPTLIDLYNSDIYRTVRKEFPNAPISIKTWGVDTPTNIESGSITLGIHYLNEDLTSHIYQKVLAQDEVSLVIAEKHPESTWDEIKDWPFIKLLTSGWNDRRFPYIEKLRAIGINPTHGIEIDNMSFAWSMLQQEKCILPTPKLSLRPHCKVVNIPDEMKLSIQLSTCIRLTDRTNPLHQYLHKIFYDALRDAPNSPIV